MSIRNLALAAAEEQRRHAEEQRRLAAEQARLQRIQRAHGVVRSVLGVDPHDVTHDGRHVLVDDLWFLVLASDKGLNLVAECPRSKSTFHHVNNGTIGNLAELGVELPLFERAVAGRLPEAHCPHCRPAWEADYAAGNLPSQQKH